MPKNSIIINDPCALTTDENTTDYRALYVDQYETTDLMLEYDSPHAITKFNNLPQSVLPPMPHGYQWTTANGSYSLIKNLDAVDHNINIVLFGPDNKNNNNLNFLTIVDGVTTYSFANTKKNAAPARKYPMTNAAYGVTGFNYKTTKYKHHVRGHLIDHQDTINMPLYTLSTFDSRNYNPEPPNYEWGMGFRRLKVDQLRKLANGGAYAQYNTYTDNPLITKDGTQVPDKARLFTYEGNANYGYVSKNVYHVDFSSTNTKPKNQSYLDFGNDEYKSSLRAAPVVVAYSPDLTDKQLAKQAQDAADKHGNIKNNTYRSRFKNDDLQEASFDAAEKEFKSITQNLNTALTCEKKLKKKYFNRVCVYGEKLQEINEKIKLFSSNDVKAITTFFAKNKNKQLEPYEDRLRAIRNNSK